MLDYYRIWLIDGDDNRDFRLFRQPLLLISLFQHPRQWYLRADDPAARSRGINGLGLWFYDCTRLLPEQKLA
jgi:hypothetical protein